MPRRIAAVAFAAALVVDLAVLLRVPHLVTSAEPSALRLAPVPALARRAPDDPALLVEAGRRAPFGGETPVLPINSAAMVVQQTMPVPTDRPRLIGTVVEGEGRGFVVVELPDSRMQLVRIGERAGSLKLRSVTAGAAVFEDARGERISLRSPQAGTGSRP